MLTKLQRHPLVPLLVGLSLAIGAPYALATSVGTNLTLSGLMTVPPGYSLDTDAAGTLNIGTTTATSITIGQSGVTTTVRGLLSSTGNASTTLLSIGGSTGTTLATVQVGTCTVVTGSVAATSTAYTTCTGAGTVDNTYKVVLEPNASGLGAGLSVDAASTTATAGTISVRVVNINAGASATIGTPTFTYWAFK
jgi:hypothetical protein